jgi:hypothetical protein
MSVFECQTISENIQKLKQEEFKDIQVLLYKFQDIQGLFQDKSFLYKFQDIQGIFVFKSKDIQGVSSFVRTLVQGEFEVLVVFFR